MSTATDLGPSRSPFGPDAAARVPSSGTGLSSTGGRVAMLVVVILAVVAAFLGSGVVGGLTPVAEAAGGWLGPDATWVSPATPAFGIWSVIYAGLFAYAVWQFLPSAQSARHDRLRPWILVSVLLNAAWIWTVQAGLLGLSVVVIALLLACLARILVLLESVRAHSWGERILLDGVQGLHLGWVSIAAVANLAAWLASTGVVGDPGQSSLWAKVMLVVAVLIGAFTAVYNGGRPAPAFALAWGLVWIGVGRADGTGLLSGSLALLAWGGAAIVLLCWLAALLLSRRAATGEARDLVLDALDGGGDPIDGRR